MERARVVELRRNPSAAVAPDDFALVEVELPVPCKGEILVRNRWMSIDPYMRLMIGSQAGYLAMAQPGDSMRGAAIGVVERSHDPGVPEGSIVLSQMGWRTRFVAPAAEVTVVDGAVPGEWHLGLFGLTGITAFLGIETVLKPGRGETVFVSGAAGAVGSLACQLARRRGARVLGSAGSAAKVAWLRDAVGVDATCNYRVEPIAAFFDRESPDGVDAFFDNVGGEMLDAVLPRMKPFGRIGLCGAISQYQSGDYRSGPANFFAAIEKSLHLQGFNAFLLPAEEISRIAAALRGWAEAGEVKPQISIVRGIDAVPDAFARLLGEGFLGKAIIALDN